MTSPTNTPAASSITHLCLVRHGESEWNAEERIQGQLDPDLTPLGVRQAEAVAKRLSGEKWDVIYSSDLTRAKRTANAIAALGGYTVRFHQGLRERYQGRIEGLLMEEARRLFPDFDSPEVGRESLAELYERARKTFAEIVEAHRGQKILVVGHGAQMGQYLTHLRDLGADIVVPRLNNTSVTRIEWAGDTPTVLLLNDTEHLAAPGKVDVDQVSTKRPQSAS